MFKNKNKNKGFMLIETLLVTMTIAGILVYMYVQFSDIDNIHGRLRKYNTVESLYRTEVVKNLLMQTTTRPDYGAISTTGIVLVNDESCTLRTQHNQFSNWDGFNSDKRNFYCQLLDELEIISAIITRVNIADANTITTDTQLRAFINSFPNETDNPDEFRIIVKFKDETFATLVFEPCLTAEDSRCSK